MFIRRLLAAACGIAVLGLTMPSTPQAFDNPSKTTYLTFNHPVRLPGVALGTGTYIFELATPMDLSLVRVLNRDRSLVYYTGFTHAIDRPSGMPPDQVVSLGESRADTAMPITVWWPRDGSRGRQFIYR